MERGALQRRLRTRRRMRKGKGVLHWSLGKGVLMRRAWPAVSDAAEE